MSSQEKEHMIKVLQKSGIHLPSQKEEDEVYQLLDGLAEVLVSSYFSQEAEAQGSDSEVL